MKGRTAAGNKNNTTGPLGWIVLLLLMVGCYSSWMIVSVSSPLTLSSSFSSSSSLSWLGLEEEEEETELQDQRKPQRQTRVTIFYNVYVPLANKGAEQAHQIIVEQLQQVAESPLLVRRRRYSSYYDDPKQPQPQPQVSIQFVTIGNPHTASLVATECRRHGMACTHLQHYHQGMESVTLNQISPYCRQLLQQGEEEIVIYLHNKGSFHPENFGQHNWRRALTDAVTSQHCANGLLGWSSSSSMSEPQSQCNVCGLLFHPLPYHHFPGNMWAAHCKYIAQLPPNVTLLAERYSHFVAHLERNHLKNHNKHSKTMKRTKQSHSHSSTTTFQSSLQPQPPTLFEFRMFKFQSNMLGSDRYQSENWIGFHPHLRPCDMTGLSAVGAETNTTTVVTSHYNHNTSSPSLPPPPVTLLEHWWTTNRTQALQEFVLNPHPPSVNLWNQQAWMFHTVPYYYGENKRYRQEYAVNTNNTTTKQQQALARRRREYFLLPGLLYKWNWIYNYNHHQNHNYNHSSKYFHHSSNSTTFSWKEEDENSNSSSSTATTRILPHRDSFIWSWYPDGDYWYHQTYGSERKEKPSKTRESKRERVSGGMSSQE